MQSVCDFYVAFVMIFAIAFEASDCLAARINSTDGILVTAQDSPNNDYVQNTYGQDMMQETSGSVLNFAVKYRWLVVLGLVSAAYGGFVFDAYRKHDEWFWFVVFLPLILPLDMVLSFYDALSRAKHLGQ